MCKRLNTTDYYTLRVVSMSHSFSIGAHTNTHTQISPKKFWFAQRFFALALSIRGRNEIWLFSLFLSLFSCFSFHQPLFIASKLFQRSKKKSMPNVDTLWNWSFVLLFSLFFGFFARDFFFAHIELVRVTAHTAYSTYTHLYTLLKTKSSFEIPIFLN